MSTASASMSEEEDDDELPAISVNASSQDLSMFVMPSADVLASQRARELQCEREIRALRAADAQRAAAGPAPGAPPLALSRSDSSGSEGEALAAAVGAMLVQPGGDAPAHCAADARALLALLRRLPGAGGGGGGGGGGLLAAYLRLLDGGAGGEHLARVTRRMVWSAWSVLACEGARWSDADVLACGAVLAACGAAGAGAGAGGAAARRALHRLLDGRAAARQVALLSEALVGAAEGGGGGAAPARALLELADAARSGARGAADELAGALVRGALRLAGAGAGDAYTRVQLAGRALGAAGGGAGAGPARARLLAALPQPPRAAPLRPEHLKVVVGAAKLQLLFGERGPGPAVERGPGPGPAVERGPGPAVERGPGPVLIID